MYDWFVMSKQALFPEAIPTIEGRKPYSMSVYEYYARSTRDHAVQARTLFDQLFVECQLEPAALKDIHGRFRSKDDENHFSALFELVVYTMFTRSGYGVASGPTLSTGRQPDFEVRSPSGVSCLVEATCVFGDKRPIAEDHFRYRLYETINDVESNCFRVSASFRGEMPDKFKKKQVEECVREWLGQLDHEEILSCQNGLLPLDGRYDFELSVSQARVILRPHALRSPKSSRLHGLILFGSLFPMQRVITDEYMLAKLREKAKQVRGADVPSIVVLNVFEAHVDDDDILTALLGSSAACETNEERESQDQLLGGRTGGLWTSGYGLRNTSIDAVLILCSVQHEGLPSQCPLMVLNPLSKASTLPMNLPFVDYRRLSDDGRILEHLKPAPRYWYSSWPINGSEE